MSVKKLRILEIPPLWEPLPPPGYGAIEYLVAAQIEQFLAKGHHVTTLGCADSDILGELVSIVPKALNHGSYQDPEVLRMIQFVECQKRAADFDVIHCHLHSNTGWLGLPMLASLAHKTVFSIHTFATDDNLRLVSMFPQANYVMTSKAHMKSYDMGFIKDYVHHGIKMEDFPFYASPVDDLYLGFLGRIRPEKGIHVAIETARKLGLPLKIAGRAKPSDMIYFETTIRPHLKHGEVEFIGELGPIEKAQFMGNAVAILNPTLIDEPFGLVVIEAMACGTPVLATLNGAMPEIIKDKETGYLFSPNAELPFTLRDIQQLDRAAIRRHVEDQFSSENMSDHYLRLFEQVSAHGKIGPKSNMGMAGNHFQVCSPV